jgi:hypothetical protein
MGRGLRAISSGGERFEVRDARFLEANCHILHTQSGFVLLLFAGFGSLLAFLRNEAKVVDGFLAGRRHLAFFALGFDFQQRGIGFVEGAFVRGLVAQVEREFRIDALGEGGFETEFLQEDGAAGQPAGADHGFKQLGFEAAAGREFSLEARAEFGVFVGVFPGVDHEARGETVDDGVLGRGGFAGFRCGSSGFERVGDGGGILSGSLVWHFFSCEMTNAAEAMAGSRGVCLLNSFSG